MRSRIRIEVATPGGSVIPMWAQLVEYNLERDPWDASTGSIELALIPEDEELEGSYIVRDGTLVGDDLAQRWASVLLRIARGEAIRVAQKRPWICQCGGAVSSTFCSLCGQRAFLETEATCGRKVHDGLEMGNYCPACGVGLAPRGRRRIRNND